MQVQVLSWALSDAETSYVTCRRSAVQLKTSEFRFQWEPKPQRAARWPDCVTRFQSSALTAPGTAPSRKWAAGSWASPGRQSRGAGRLRQAPGRHRPARDGSRSRRETPTSTGPTVRELLFRYITEEIPRFSDAERHCQKGAIRELFGGTPLAEFVSQSLVDSLKTVRSPPISDQRQRTAVPEEKLVAVRSLLRARNRDLFDLVLLMGARPGELLGLTTAMIERSGEVRRADLARRKTAHNGKRRALFVRIRREPRPRSASRGPCRSSRQCSR